MITRRVILVLLVLVGCMEVFSASGSFAAAVPPEALRVAEVLKRFGRIDTANRFIQDIKGDRAVFVSLPGDTNAQTGRWVSLRGKTGVEFSSKMLTQINTRAPLSDTVTISWAITVAHEYVHMDQGSPAPVARFEDPAWRHSLETAQDWMRQTRTDMGKAVQLPDSMEKVRRLDELGRWIEALRRTHSDVITGITENIQSGIVSPNLEWPNIDMSYSRDLRFVKETTENKARLWKDFASSEGNKTKDRLNQNNRGRQTDNPLQLTKKQEDDLLYCVCKVGCSAAARYNLQPLDASPSCKDVSNGPCVCQGFGCTRSRILIKDTEACMKKSGIAGDKLAVTTWIYERNLGHVMQSERQSEAKTLPSIGAARIVSKNRPSNQSSRSQWSKTNDAQGAVDGVKNGRFGFHTDIQMNPWWQVDMGNLNKLRELIIYNRLDSNPERSRTIQVMLSDDGKRWRTEYTHDGSIFGGIDGNPLKVKLKDQKARYLRLQLNEKTYFHLDEVEVFADN